MKNSTLPIGTIIKRESDGKYFEVVSPGHKTIVRELDSFFGTILAFNFVVISDAIVKE